MLREIDHVKQDASDYQKRWFQSEKMDLFIWSQEKEISYFQLSYDKYHAEKSFNWHKNHAHSHTLIEDGSKPGHYPATPLLSEQCPLNKTTLLTLFEHEAHALEPAVKTFIAEKISNFHDNSESC